MSRTKQIIIALVMLWFSGYMLYDGYCQFAEERRVPSLIDDRHVYTVEVILPNGEVFASWKSRGLPWRASNTSGDWYLEDANTKKILWIGGPVIIKE